MYTSPDSVLFWLCRSVYLALVISALWLDGVGRGEYGLLHPISPLLLPLACAGLIAFEFGIAVALRRKKVQARGNEAREAALVPFILWAVGAVAVLVLFALKGIPLFTDPDRRAVVGQGAGVLKRLSIVWFPLASVELFVLSRGGRSAGASILAWPVVLVTLVVLVLVTAKAPILLFLILLFLTDWQRKSVRSMSTRQNSWPLLMGLAGLAGAATTAYARFATEAPFVALIGFRLTTMVANMPNYILLGLTGTPSASELMLHNLRSILSTFRIPFVSPPVVLETQLSEHVLGRWVEMGGLSPTVVGEGWIVGGAVGVILLSLLFGLLSGACVRIARMSRSAYSVSFSYFSAFAVYYPMQFFAVGAFLDWGLSLLAYRVAHFMLTAATEGQRRIAGSGGLMSGVSA